LVALIDPITVTLPITESPVNALIPERNWFSSDHPPFVGRPQLFDPMIGCGNPRLVFGISIPHRKPANRNRVRKSDGGLCSIDADCCA
jgi:hypothetical protein